MKRGPNSRKEPTWTRKKAKEKPPRCPGNKRHWFTYYGKVGSKSPTCVRCGLRRPQLKGNSQINEHEASA